MRRYIQAIRTNVLATAVIADLAIKFSSTCFVQISTDKEVEPSSVMGFRDEKLMKLLCNLKTN